MRNNIKHKKSFKSRRILKKSRRSKRKIRKGMQGGSIKTFVVYGRMTCPYTREALEILKRKNKANTFYDIEQNQKYDKMLEKLKIYGTVPKDYSTVPVILNNNKFIGGKTELSMLNL